MELLYFFDKADGIDISELANDVLGHKHRYLMHTPGASIFLYIKFIGAV
jgi:hypothetical protein